MHLDNREIHQRKSIEVTLVSLLLAGTKFSDF